MLKCFSVLKGTDTHTHAHTRHAIRLHSIVYKLRTNTAARALFLFAD